MDDLLVKQLLGRYVKNRLRVQTVITHIDQMNISEQELIKLIEYKMITLLAENIVKENTLHNRTIGENSYNCVGREVQIETYCFTRGTISELIQAAFTAGMEVRKDD